MDGIRHVAKIGSLVIPLGQSDSGDINALEMGRVGLQSAVGITIYGPSSLDGAVVVQVQSFTNPTWRILTSGDVDVVIRAGRAVVISPLPFKNLRLHSSGPESDNRVFDIDAQI